MRKRFRFYKFKGLSDFKFFRFFAVNNEMTKI